MKRPTIGKREGSILDKAAFRLPTFTTKGILSTLDTDLIAAGGEFIGTVMFLLAGLGVSGSDHGALEMLECSS
jgi:hypothetical protein